METQYTVDYFIKKFEAIPEELWTIGAYIDGDKRCALGHCGADNYTDVSLIDEAYAIDELLLQGLGSVMAGSVTAVINDADDPRYQQPTPKQRILAALNDIKKTQTLCTH